MKILDIDLDFFLNDKAHSSVTAEDRLEDYYVPWNKADVKSFLENNCGLSGKNKIKAKCFIHHDEVFYFLRELQGKNNNDLSFSIDHIDAHADLGLGDSSFKYISTKVLFKKLESRGYDNLINGWSGLSAGNYLAFAIACRWVSEINYINKPEWSNDLPWFNFENFDTTTNNIQLKKFDETQMEDIMQNMTEMLEMARSTPSLELEPIVPFNTINYKTFKSSGEYDFIFLTQSPGFTPESSDKLIPLIQRYMQLD